MSTPFDKRNRDLEVAIDELRQLVDAEMKARQASAGPVNRDVITARVLMDQPDLHERIEAMASSDDVHKARVVRPGEKSAVRKVMEGDVEREALELMATGAEETIEKARVRVWRSDAGRLDAYNLSAHGSAGITALHTKHAADQAIAKIADILGGADVVVGHRLACEKFPRLAAAARGMPQVVR